MLFLLPILLACLVMSRGGGYFVLLVVIFRLLPRPSIILLLPCIDLRRFSSMAFLLPFLFSSIIPIIIFQFILCFYHIANYSVSASS